MHGLRQLPLPAHPIGLRVAYRARFRTQYLRCLAKTALVGHKSAFSGTLTFNDTAPVPFRVTGQVPEFSVVFTTARGLFHFDSGAGIVKRLVSGKAYGIACHDNDLYLSKIHASGPKNRRASDIFRIRLDRLADVLDAQRVIAGIPEEVHQIDIADGHLIIPHTGYEHVLFCPLLKIKNNKRLLMVLDLDVVAFDIAGRSHLNSCFWDSETGAYFFIAHNSTAHTGRSSDIVAYYPVEQTAARIATVARSAHNLALLDGDLYYRDSDRGRLIVNGTTVFECGKLLRGLSVTTQHIFLGGSDICFDRDLRRSSTPTLYVLDRGFELLGSVEFPEVGDIYEIRQFGARDLAMSGRA